MKRIRLSNTEWIEPGDEIPSGVRKFRLLAWWRRGFVEQAGSNLAESKVAKHMARLEREGGTPPKSPAKKKTRKVKKRSDIVHERLFEEGEHLEEPNEG